MTEFRARLELGAINFHLKPCMITWAKIGFPLKLSYWQIVFKNIQLSFDIYRVSNHHLVHDIHQMIGGQHNLIFNEPSHHLAFPTSNMGLRTSRHACRLVVANVTFQYPAAPLGILQFLSMCNDNVPLFGGGLPLDVFSILEAEGHDRCNGSLRVAFSFIRLHVYRIGPELYFR